MSIKTFEDWVSNLKKDIGVDKMSPFDATKFVYESALEESKNHYEADRLAIHEYYTAKVRELLGQPDIELDQYSETHGKLT